jgi:hypothetical protein
VLFFKIYWKPEERKSQFRKSSSYLNYLEDIRFVNRVL